jgi:recombination protein RecA
LTTNKTYGKGTVMKMGDRAIVEVETISSGSLGIDLALELVVTKGKSY